MRRTPAPVLPALAALAVLAAAAAVPAAAAPDRLATAAAIRDAARAASTAFPILASLTTEVGPRLAGSAAEARARDWAVKAMTAAGLANVHVEPFTLVGWERGAESAEVVGVHAQRLAVTALGRSGATPAAGITAPVVYFADLQALKDAAPGSLAGRIAFIDHHMTVTQDGSGYGANNAVRTLGPAIAAAKGAAATLIRSLGTGDAATGSSRDPHTGVTVTPPGQAPTPAGALSLADADQLVRLLALGPVSVHLTLTPRFTGTAPSGNVVGEIPGTGAPQEIIVLGGHLDSWDLGTGTIDDGAGVAITLAAVKAIKAAGVAPRRTIRLVFWGSEEVGGEGGEAYADAHRGDTTMLAGESDDGGDRIYRLSSKVAGAGLPLVADIARVLAPLGIDATGNNAARGGADVGTLGRRGAGILALEQDASRYFAIHHTAQDTLDKIDRGQLDQNVAAWAAAVWLAASDSRDLRGQ